MTKEEKCILAIDKGFTYDSITGIIYGIRGNEIKSKNRGGYIDIKLTIGIDNKRLNLMAHQFGYYCVYKKVVDIIDHIDGDKSNNKIDNLREVTNQQNAFNNKMAKGYTYDRGKYRACIVINAKKIYLGSFDTSEEARQAYLDAKKIYHII